MNKCISEPKNQIITDLSLFFLEILRSFRFRLFIFVLLIYIAGATLDITNTNPGSRFMLTKSIAKHGEFTIHLEDQERYSYLDYSIYNGSIYSDKAPGVSLLAVPIYWIGDFISVRILGVNPDNWQLVDDVIKFLIMISVLIFGAFSVLKFYDFLRLLDISHKSANWTTLIFAFGSLYYVYIGTFFAHAIVAAFILLAVFFSTKFQKTKEISSLIYSSFFAGYTVVCDYITVFLIPFLVIYTFLPFLCNLKNIFSNIKHYIKFYLFTIILYLIPLSICAFLVLFYNFSCFGDPFATPYKFSRFFWDKQHFASSMFTGFNVLILSRHHGLIQFMPIVLISIFGLIPMVKKNPSLAILCITIPLLVILLYSKYFLPTGGLAYGPRHIVSIIPFLIIPLGFLLDLKHYNDSTSPIREKFIAMIISLLKISIIFLCFISLLINLAGGWVGVYPLGGEGMIDPIWGTKEQIGHIETFLNYFQIFFNVPANLTLKFLQGNYEGGFQFEVFIITFKLYLTWPSASSLAHGNVETFFGVLFLAFLINPYYSPFRISEKLSNNLKSISLPNHSKKYLYAWISVEVIVFILFSIWILIDGIEFIRNPLRSGILAFQSFLNDKYYLIAKIPLLNVIIGTLKFIVFSILNLVFFRYDAFSLNSWFLNSLIFLFIINIPVFSFKQLKGVLSKDLDSPVEGTDNNIVQTNDFNELFLNSSIFKKYQLATKTLIIGYIVTSIFSLFPLLFNRSLISLIPLNLVLKNNFFFSNLSLILYYLIFLFIITGSLTHFSIRYIKNDLVGENRIKKHSSGSLPQKDINHGTFITSVLFLVIFLVFLLNIIIKMLISGFTISNLFFIEPLFLFEPIENWFKTIKHSVIVYLILMLILIGIILLVNIYQLGIDSGVLSDRFSYFPKTLENRLCSISLELSLFQSILFFGGILVLFIYLLLTHFYSLLSTVPDISLLPEPIKEYPEEFYLLILLSISYIWGLIYSGNRYWKSIRNLKKGQNTSQKEIN